MLCHDSQEWYRVAAPEVWGYLRPFQSMLGIFLKPRAQGHL